MLTSITIRSTRVVSLRSAVRSFATSIPKREHFLNSTPEVFKERVVNGDDRVILVDFFAECVSDSAIAS